MKINNVEDIYKVISKIEYGWLDNTGVKHYKLNMDEYKEKYRLQSPEEVMKNQIGVCWDQVELERQCFEILKKEVESYIIVNDDKYNYRVHTFLIYYDKNKVIWFEHAWGNYKGIHEFNIKKDLFKMVKDIFIKEELKNKEYKEEKIHIYLYRKPKSHINYYQYMNHTINEKSIDQLK